MSDEDKNREMQRRKVIKSFGAASGMMATGALGFSGAAAAEKDKRKNGKINTSDWEVDLDVSDDQVNAKEIYVGKNKNADLTPDSIAARSRRDSVNSEDVSTEDWSVSSSATLLTWVIPSEVPYIGGDTLTLEASVSVSLTSADISLDICLNGSSCISIAGVNVSIGSGDISADVKGSFYGVPFTLEGSVGYDISVDVWSLSADVNLTASAQVCLGRDLCDTDADGWESIGCALCASASQSVELI